MRNWLRTVLFISAFSPALITMAYVRYDIYGWRTDVFQLTCIGLIGSLIPFAIIKLVKKHGESFIVQAKKVESNDFMLFAFITSYILPFVLKGYDVSVNSIVIILTMLGIIFGLINSLPAHPLLRAMKFRFYKFEASNGMVYTLISNREILDPKEIRTVKKISQSMLMEDRTHV